MHVTFLVGQNCNTSGLPYTGNITPPICDGTTLTTTLADDGASYAILVADSSVFYTFDLGYNPFPLYIEIYDSGGVFITSRNITIDPFTYLPLPVSWYSNLNDTMTIKIYEMYTCTPYGFPGSIDLTTYCSAPTTPTNNGQQCSYQTSNINLGDFTPPHTQHHYQTVNATSGEYFTMNVIAGVRYEISTCNNATWNTQLELYKSGGSTFVAANNYGCGLGNLQSAIHYIADYTGVLEVHLSELDCIYTGSQPSFDIEVVTIGTYSGTYIVNTTDTINDGLCDAVHCSLAEAGEKAMIDNKNSYIEFDIPTPPPHVLTGTTIHSNEFTSIDGYTQPGFMLGDIVFENGISTGPINCIIDEFYGFNLEVYGIHFQGSSVDLVSPENAYIGDSLRSNIFSESGGVDLSSDLNCNSIWYDMFYGPVWTKELKIENNYFGVDSLGNELSPLSIGVYIAGNFNGIPIIKSNEFVNCNTAIYKSSYPFLQSQCVEIINNEFYCNNTNFESPLSGNGVGNNTTIPPSIDSLTIDSLYGSMAQLPVLYQAASVDIYQAAICNPNGTEADQYLGSSIPDANGNWTFAHGGLNAYESLVAKANHVEHYSCNEPYNYDYLNASTLFSTPFIVYPSQCDFAEFLPVNTDPCSTVGAIIDMDFIDDSYQAPYGSCSSSYVGNDAWLKVTVPATGNFLVRQNLDNTINAVVESYTGTCGSLFLENCSEIDSIPYATVFEGYQPNSEVYLRIWDKNNTVVNTNGVSALLHLTAHELPQNKEDWLICDQENNLSNGNPTIISEREASAGIYDMTSLSSAEIQEERDSLIAGGATLKDSFWCSNVKLDLWENTNPIEMEENKRGSRLRARVDTINYNYVFETLEFQINDHSRGEQINPRVDMDSDGDFIIVWEDVQRRTNYGIVYNSAGNPLTAEFPIGSNNQNLKQIHNSLAFYDNDEFVVVWEQLDLSSSPPQSSIFAKQFYPEGGANIKTPIFNLSELSICGTGSSCNPPTGIEESAARGKNPSVSTNGTDRFAVCWTSGYELYVQIFDNDAQLVGPPIQVSIDNSYILQPQLSMNATGEFIVGWEDADSHNSGIQVQKYNVDGTPNGAVIQANTTENKTQSYPTLELMDDGSFIVAWQSYEQEGVGNDFGIYAQLFDSSCNKIGGEIHVNSYTTDVQKRPSITTFNDGTFFITWSSYGQDGFEEGIYGQFFDNSGIPIGSEEQINTYTEPEQDLPRTSCNGESIMVTTWVDGANDSDGKGIFGQRYEIIDQGGQKIFYKIGTATPSTLLGDTLMYPGTVYAPQDSFSSVRVAIIDTGVDINNPFFSTAMWNNQQTGVGCFINDTLGYDFVNEIPNPIDYDGHGTKVNAIVARDFPADIQLELMNLKFHENDRGNLFDAISAIYYAVDNGADIINMSWGFEASDPPSTLEDAIQYASDNDVLLVTTAGNTSKDNDIIDKYPNNYSIQNMIKVASYVNKNGTVEKANFSSSGKTTVDIGAPGFMQVPGIGGILELASGTSLSAPHITRTAAIIKGLFPNLTASDIKDCILNSAEPESELTDKVATGGILDHDSAIDCAYDKAANCVAIDLYITIPQQLDTIYRSDVYVETDAEINSNADVEMWGAEYVKMLPGFETTLGTEYLADIDDCDPLNTPNTLQGGEQEENGKLRLRENSVLAGKIKVQFYYDGGAAELVIKSEQGEEVKVYSFDPGAEGWYEKIIDAKLLRSGIYQMEYRYAEKTEKKLFQIQNRDYSRYVDRVKRKAEE